VMGPLVAALFMAFWGIFIREFGHEDHRPKPAGETPPPEQGNESGPDVR